MQWNPLCGPHPHLVWHAVFWLCSSWSRTRCALWRFKGKGGPGESSPANHVPLRPRSLMNS